MYKKIVIKLSSQFFDFHFWQCIIIVQLFFYVHLPCNFYTNCNATIDNVMISFYVSHSFLYWLFDGDKVYLKSNVWSVFSFISDSCISEVSMAYTQNLPTTQCDISYSFKGKGILKRKAYYTVRIMYQLSSSHCQ